MAEEKAAGPVRAFASAGDLLSALQDPNARLSVFVAGWRDAKRRREPWAAILGVPDAADLVPYAEAATRRVKRMLALAPTPADNWASPQARAGALSDLDSELVREICRAAWSDTPLSDLQPEVHGLVLRTRASHGADLRSLPGELPRGLAILATGRNPFPRASRDGGDLAFTLDRGQLRRAPTIVVLDPGLDLLVFGSGYIATSARALDACYINPTVRDARTAEAKRLVGGYFVRDGDAIEAASGDRNFERRLRAIIRGRTMAAVDDVRARGREVARDFRLDVAFEDGEVPRMSSRQWGRWDALRLIDYGCLTSPLTQRKYTTESKSVWKRLVVLRVGLAGSRVASVMCEDDSVRSAEDVAAAMTASPPTEFVISHGRAFIRIENRGDDEEPDLWASESVGSKNNLLLDPEAVAQLGPVPPAGTYGPATDPAPSRIRGVMGARVPRRAEPRSRRRAPRTPPAAPG